MSITVHVEADLTLTVAATVRVEFSDPETERPGAATEIREYTVHADDDTMFCECCRPKLLGLVAAELDRLAVAAAEVNR